MALLKTPALDDLFIAHDFSLKGTDGEYYDLASVQGPHGLVVMFICNHCPYVKGMIGRLVRDCHFLQKKGIGVIAVMPNDTESYEADSFANMKQFAAAHGFNFPYVIDETQAVARAYGAVCTPDIFGFNSEGVMQYRGRLDSAGAHEEDGNTRHDLVEAMALIAKTGAGPEEQYPSMGCSIKWRA